MSDRRIRIGAGEVTVFARLDDGPMADAILAALPITGAAETWGDEIYFGVPVTAPPNAGPGVETVEMGAVGFWPPRSRPVSLLRPHADEPRRRIRPASAVHVMGRIEGDPRVLKKVPPRTRVSIEQV